MDGHYVSRIATLIEPDLDVGLSGPTRADLPLVALAGVGPVALVGLTKLVGTVTGVPYNSLTMTSYAADAPLVPVATVAGLGLLIGVPTLVLVCQVFVQASFMQVVEDNIAIVLTTLVAGFLVGSSTGGSQSRRSSEDSLVLESA